MAPPRMRPRFERVVAASPDAVVHRLAHALNDPRSPFVAQVAGRHLHLRVAAPERRLWSPHLNLEVEPHPEGALVLGHFGPHPDVWTFFVALYAVLAFTATVGLLFGASQWMLGTTPVAFWAVPLALLLALLVYGLALVGQRLSQEQMRQLYHFVDDLLTATASTDPPGADGVLKSPTPRET